MSPFEGIFAIGILIFLSGLFATALLLPKWALELYLFCSFLLLVLLAHPMGKGIDWLHARIIHRHLNKLGASGIDVKPFSNHYGVHFTFDGTRHYAKCTVGRWGRLRWKGKSADDLLRSSTVV